MMFRNGVPSSSVPLGLMSGPSCVVTPVMPVMHVMRIASSRGLSGAGWFLLWWVSGPALSDVPRASRRVRRSTSADISGYSKSSFRDGCCSECGAVPAFGYACTFVMLAPREFRSVVPVQLCGHDGVYVPRGILADEAVHVRVVLEDVAHVVVRSVLLPQ